MTKNKKYPKINYIGNKEKLSAWICEQFPSDTKSVFDAFSGGGSVGYEAKKRGYKVISNDILKINYHLCKSLIQNSNEVLSGEDIEIIFSGEATKGFMYENYADVFFFGSECMELDQYRNNIKKLSNEYKKSMALILMRRAMIRKMPYSRFNLKWANIKQLRNENYSYSKFGRRRGYHNESLKSHFLNNLEEYNDAVFCNGEDNKAFNCDIFDLLGEVKTDVIYLDPPYAGTMNNYYGFYGLIDNYISSEKIGAFDNNFVGKKSSFELFDRLFSSLGNFKYWILSYNNNAHPSKDDLMKIIGKYSKDIKIVEKPHNYKLSGKANKSKNIEYLFIVKNENIISS